MFFSEPDKFSRAVYFTQDVEQKTMEGSNPVGFIKICTLTCTWLAIRHLKLFFSRFLLWKYFLNSCIVLPSVFLFFRNCWTCSTRQSFLYSLWKHPRCYIRITKWYIFYYRFIRESTIQGKNTTTGLFLNFAVKIFNDVERLSLGREARNNHI